MKLKENKPFWLGQTLPQDVQNQLVGLVEIAKSASTSPLESKTLLGDFGRICYAWKLNSFEILAQIILNEAESLRCACGFIGKSIHSINAHKAKCTKHEK